MGSISAIVRSDYRTYSFINMVKGVGDLYIAVKFMIYFEYFKKVKIAKMEEKGKKFTRREYLVRISKLIMLIANKLCLHSHDIRVCGSINQKSSDTSGSILRRYGL